MRYISKKLIFKILLAMIGLVLAFSVVLAIESASLYYIKKLGMKPKPFLINTLKQIKRVGGSTHLSYIDPHLGFSIDPKVLKVDHIPGFAIYGANNGKNMITNGKFNLWSKGIKQTFTGDTNSYPDLADGWTIGYRDGVTTISREVFSPNQTGVPDKPKNYHRWKQTEGTTKSAPFLGFKIPGIKGFEGSTVRLSFYAKADRKIEVSLYAKQSFGGSRPVDTILNRRLSENRFVLSTSWKKYTRTFVVTSALEKNIASSVGYLGFSIYMPLAATYTFDIAQVRLERILAKTNIHKRSATGPRVLTIIALGGSTTDPRNNQNWAKQLQKKLDKRNIKSLVFNGGMSGYSSNQEFLKLTRDALPLRPDLIISLNGVNDLGFIHSLKKHPMVHPYQRNMLRYIAEPVDFLLPNTFFLIKRYRNKATPEKYRVTGINYGPENVTTAAKQWEKNIRMMRAISKEFGVEYQVFLQPILGFGDYNPSAEEEGMLREKIEITKKQKYIQKLTAFYQSAKEKCNDISHCNDITDVYGGMTGMFNDPRHPTGEGYGIIADKMIETLAAKGLLKDYVKSAR